MNGPYEKSYARFPTIRQSRAATFDACPLSSKFEADHLDGTHTSPAVRGTLVHRTLAKCMARMEQRRQPTTSVDEALTVLDDVIRQADVPMESDGLSDAVLPISLHEIADARITVKTWALYARVQIAHVAGIEKRLATTLLYPDGAGGWVEREITGQLDLLLIDGVHATVVDYKDTWGIPPQKEPHQRTDDDELSDEGFFQQRFYGLLVFRRYPRVEAVTLDETYLRYLSGEVPDRHGRKIDPHRTATLTRSAVPELEREISALIERFDRSHHTGKFPPKGGAHCSYCPRPEACTVFPGARVEGAIGSQEDAERLAARLQVSEARSKQIRAALRAWSKQHGDVVVRSEKRPRVFGPVVRQETSKPSAEEAAAHIAAGGRVEDLFVTKPKVTFTVHSPDEVHPHVAEVRAEEERLLAEQQAGAA